MYLYFFKKQTPLINEYIWRQLLLPSASSDPQENTPHRELSSCSSCSGTEVFIFVYTLPDVVWTCFLTQLCKTIIICVFPSLIFSCCLPKGQKVFIYFYFLRKKVRECPAAVWNHFAGRKNSTCWVCLSPGDVATVSTVNDFILFL